MMETILKILELLAVAAPFVIFALLNARVNVKRTFRARQFPMPVLVLIYSIVLFLLFDKLHGLMENLVELLSKWATSIQNWDPSGVMHYIAEVVKAIGRFLPYMLQKWGVEIIIAGLLNLLIMIAHLILKRILVSIFKAVFKNDGGVLSACAGVFYEYDDESDGWYVKRHFGKARTFVKTIYTVIFIVSVLGMLISFKLIADDVISGAYYPVFGIMIIGEIFFFLNGLTKKEAVGSIAGENENSGKRGDYTLLRKALARLFVDKLTAENTVVNSGLFGNISCDEIIREFEGSESAREASYGIFMRDKYLAGDKLDSNYLKSGMQLLKGQSILFNTPFYYDLIPYAFFAMNDALIRHKKVLIILGRHDTEEDIKRWCEEGFFAVNNVAELWRIGVLGNAEGTLDVGIITRSDVHNLQLHEKNAAFFEQVAFVMLIEPSRLVTTAQVGLNSVVRRCKSAGETPVFCSTDKNCDGLVDALSHILLTSICEVSATNKPSGTSSYMCWATDQEHLQHRLTPNISRYLGMGTELSFVGLKNQVSSASWYGGDAFPVNDIHWIDKQYYYDLLHYAGLATTQDNLDKVFKVSANMWDCKVEDFQYMTVEDEACNMFEMRRDFSTRASEQGFVNVITSDYLLRDYMAENDALFTVDPKAIPYIVADYAHTRRNVILRLCLLMSSGIVSERDIRRDFALLDLNDENMRDSMWHEICLCYSPVGHIQMLKDKEVLVRVYNGREVVFDVDTIKVRRKFSMKSGTMEDCYFIADQKFFDLFLSDLQNANYIAESEDGDNFYLGSELQGHIYQKYLPGQFFTFAGKYYEMLRVTGKGKVLLRRAADHITGRPMYRQVRLYSMGNVVESDVMGARVDVAGLKLTKMFADIHVETPAFWKMETYNDFETAKKVEVSGIPARDYYNKHFLKIELPDQNGKLTENITHTITVLFNEIFRTLFAENQNYIVAISSVEACIPDTYSIINEEMGPGTIYIVEDSQLDIGLLEAVERNLNRIFSIICDYLKWHSEAIEASINPQAKPKAPVYTLLTDGDEKKETPKKKGMAKQFSDFVKKIFGRKKKDEPEKPAPDASENEADENAADTAEGEIREDNPESAVEPEQVEAEVPQTESEADENAAETSEDEADENTADTAENEADGDSAEAIEDETDGDIADMVESEADGDSAEAIEDETDGDIADAAESEADGDSAEAAEDNADENTAEASESEADEVAAETADAENDPADEKPMALFSVAADSVTAYPDENESEDDPERNVAAGADETHGVPVRKPYHERHYLLYGGSEVPEGIDIDGTLAFIQSMGFAGGELEQARKGKDIAALVERTFKPDVSGVRYCDFCGNEILGTEYEALADGRERCMTCGRTAVKSEEEFKDIYNEVLKFMETFFGIRIAAAVKVRMVNSKTLHKRLGMTFVPTGNMDGRVLGVAIMDKTGYSLLLENGAPRLQTTMTIAHELTHIWQYLNWDQKKIKQMYGQNEVLEIYEGMAKWVEIQYAWLINESAAAKREEMITMSRNDEYGRGFIRYANTYPISQSSQLRGATPFDNKEKPL